MLTKNRLNFKKELNKIDWVLLLFLLLFLNVKLVIKIPAIILIYLLKFNFRFGFSFKNSRLPLFYLLVIVIGFIDLFLNRSYSNTNYLVVFLMGIGFWLLCVLAIHQIKLSVENNDVKVLHHTILVFFIINAVVSFCNITYIMADAHSINPYTYQGQYQKYFLGTGDYIRGVTFDISTTNALINAFGVVYFLTRKSYLMVLVCMVILLLTASNFINVALVVVLGFLFLFKTDRDQKSIVVACLMFLVVFMAKISPQNSNYVHETVKNIIHTQKAPFKQAAVIAVPDSLTTPEGIKRQFARQYLDSLKATQQQKVITKPQVALALPQTGAGRIIIKGADINTPPYQTPTDTPAEQRTLLAFIKTHKTELPISGNDNEKIYLPGKALGMLQTMQFFKSHPAEIVTGTGMGNFSSKLAFKSTGLGFSGGFPARYAYISQNFLANHLDIYLNFFSKKRELQSLTNNPFTVYDQVLAEYGLLGLSAFILFYLGFFTRHLKKLSYGLPILLLMLAAFFMDYWFEQLSVIVFFELLLLLNIKETSSPKLLNYEQ